MDRQAVAVLDQLEPEDEQEERSYSSDEPVAEGLAAVGETILSEEEIPQFDPASLSARQVMMKDHAFYDQLYSRVVDELDGADYQTDDLYEYIVRSHGTERSNLQQKLWGMYTAALLQHLTEQDDDTTRFYFNGGGERFDYLFYAANNIDELYLENLQGRNVASRLAGNAGDADAVVLKDIDGNSVANRIGELGGGVDVALFSNVTGVNTGSYLGSGGTVRFLLHDKVSSDHLWSEFKNIDTVEADHIITEEEADGIYEQLFKAAEIADWQKFSRLTSRIGELYG